jgi:hypothetical protein
MKRTLASFVVAVVIGTCAFMSTSSSSNAATGLTAAKAQQIGVDAYIYGYSLVTSEITRMATTNTVAVDLKTLQAPMGQIVSLPGYPPATYKGVTAPNADTLYSFGLFDV